MRAYPAAVAIAIFSLLIIFLLVPPMWWHLRNRNVGATSVIIWLIIMNLITFVNAILWPNDDFDGYLGQGLCDVEVKLQIASQIAFSASFACVLRALAIVMDTKRLVVSQTEMQKRRNMIIDLMWCFGFPTLQMFFHYIVQSNRYYLFGIAGCVPGASNSWLTVLLILVPPVIWVVICAVYAALILIRLHRYRRSFQQMLFNHGTNKSRFLRLFLLCVLWIFGNVPTQCYVFYVSMSVPRESYDWNDVHDSEHWKSIIAIPSQGSVLYDRYIWLASGAVMFLFFGFGTEALQMYRDGIKAMRMARLVLSCLKKSQKEPLPGTGSQDRIWKQQATQSSERESDYTVSRSSMAYKVANINLVGIEKDSGHSTGV